VPNPAPNKSPTTKPADGLNPALERNIDAIMQRRRKSQQATGAQERAAAWISKFAGSMLFVYIHRAKCVPQCDDTETCRQCPISDQSGKGVEIFWP
jgi:hypothetical protein